jgi:hypothetical protein
MARIINGENLGGNENDFTIPQAFASCENFPRSLSPIFSGYQVARGKWDSAGNFIFRLLSTA